VGGWLADGRPPWGFAVAELATEPRGSPAKLAAERPVPLPPRLTAEEEGAHLRFVKTLGSNPLWLGYLAVTLAPALPRGSEPHAAGSLNCCSPSCLPFPLVFRRRYPVHNPSRLAPTPSQPSRPA